MEKQNRIVSKGKNLENVSFNIWKNVSYLYSDEAIRTSLISKVLFNKIHESIPYQNDLTQEIENLNISSTNNISIFENEAIRIQKMDTLNYRDHCSPKWQTMIGLIIGLIVSTISVR